MSTKGTAPDAPLIAQREPIHDWLEDRRAEHIGRLLFDARRAANRWAPKSMPKTDREALAQDAACVILQWDGASGKEDGAYVISCGRAGCAPSRAVWRLEDDWREPSNAAWILLHRAITQALRAPIRLGWRPDHRTDSTGAVIEERRELATDPVELERLAEAAPAAPSLAQLGADHGARDDARQGVYPPIPDDVAVRDVADVTGMPVRAARALAYAACGMSPSDAAREWGMTLGAAKVAISNGAAWIRDHYPDTPEGALGLLELLDGAARKLRAMRIEEAAEALRVWRAQAAPDADPLDVTDGTGAPIPVDVLRAEAQLAVTRWRESSRTAPAAIVALETAARNAARRSGATGTDPGAVVRVISRAVSRAQRSAKVGRTANVGADVSASALPLSRFRVIGNGAARFADDAHGAAPGVIRACPVCWKVHPSGYPVGIHPRSGAVL